MKYKISIALVLARLLLYPSVYALAHDTSQHVDPDLLAGWLTWAHLTIQWTHLTVFALWFGLDGMMRMINMMDQCSAMMESMRSNIRKECNLGKSSA